MALVRKIIETTLSAGSTSVTFSDSTIPNSLLRVYSTNDDVFPISQTLSGNVLTVSYDMQTSDMGVALEIVKQGLEIIDDLTSDDTDKALSAKQGKTLKALIDQYSIPDLTDLPDVKVTNIQNNQVLAWSSSEQKFVNVNQSGGGGVTYLDDLSDVSIISPTDDQCLVYDNGDWVNKTLSPGGDTVSITPTLSSGTKIADFEIDGVSDALYAPNQTTVIANPAGSASAQLNKLQVDSTIYSISSGGGASSLNDLSDVTITSASQGQVLMKGSSVWENASLSKTDVGLGNVDNTSDINKPVSTATQTAINNAHKVTTKAVDLTSWTTDTTSQSGTTLYKKQITLNHIYAAPSIDVGAASGSVLPTVAQQTAYDLLQYVTFDDTVPCLYLYASAIPSTAFYINVEGVD